MCVCEISGHFLLLNSSVTQHRPNLFLLLVAQPLKPVWINETSHSTGSPLVPGVIVAPPP